MLSGCLLTTGAHPGAPLSVGGRGEQAAVSIVVAQSVRAMADAEEPSRPAYDPRRRKRTFHLLQEADISHATDTPKKNYLTGSYRISIIGFVHRKDER